MAIICRLFAHDYKSHAKGLPDLFLASFKRAEYKMVEVKGPNDRLSDAQWYWIGIFRKHKMPFEVCKVMTDTGKQLKKRKNKTV